MGAAGVRRDGDHRQLWLGRGIRCRRRIERGLRTRRQASGAVPRGVGLS